MRQASRIVVTVAAALCLVAGLAARGASGGGREEARARVLFGQAQKKIAVMAATEHIELGVWCRDAGLVPQATAEFLRAVEVTNGEMPYAVKLVNLMRKLDDKFWKTVQKHPKALLTTYEKKAHRVEIAHQKLMLRLAHDAEECRLPEEAYTEYSLVVRMTDAPLEFDAEGRVVVEAGKMPADVSARMKAEAITIDGKPYLRDDFLLLVPDVKEVFEADGERLRVRSAASGAQAKDLQAIATALLPFLEDELDGRPKRKMNLFVFKDRATFGTWCDKAGRGGFRAASGLADGATFTAIVCGEGIDADALRGMCLHELTHLFHYGVTPTVMPSWYSEGFAETYGGDGTFAWEPEYAKLTAGGPMSKGRLESIRTPDGCMPLAELLAADALKTLTADRSKGMRFYTQSWAFLRYMRTAAPNPVQARFHVWELACRGAALGAQPGKPREEDTLPASQAFQTTFGTELDALEKGFRTWLAAQ